MPDTVPDDVLRAKGISVLEEGLGPVQTIRFLAMISREPFDYQRWRQERFEGMTVAEVLANCRPTRE